MGRPAKFSEDEMLDVAAGLLVEGGPGALSASAVARTLAAPSGSVYHRFRSRDHVAAALWLRTVERFDAEVVAGLDDPGDPVEVAVAVARRTIGWSTDHPIDAFVLTTYRREDLVVGDVPEAVALRAIELGRRQRATIARLAGRLRRPADVVSFAVAGITLAAVRPSVGGGTPIPAWVPDAVERAVRAVLTDPEPRGKA